jgi:hypothetical protein
MRTLQEQPPSVGALLVRATRVGPRACRWVRARYASDVSMVRVTGNVSLAALPLPASEGLPFRSQTKSLVRSCR